MKRAFARLAGLGGEFEHIAKYPDDCLHVHIAGDHGQPGVSDMDDVYLRLFRILRNIGDTRGVSAACPWVSTDSDPGDFGKETAKTLAYLKGLCGIICFTAESADSAEVFCIPLRSPR